MKLLKLLNDENITDEEVESFKYRRAVRVIAFDQERKIALVHAKIRGYYELPGGGVEKGETLEDGAIREIKEEAGCDVKIMGKVGIVKEYLKSKELINESSCYTADVISEKGELNLMQDEIAEGKEVIWVEVSEAIKLIESTSETSTYATPLQVKYTKIRDITFLNNINQ